MSPLNRTMKEGDVSHIEPGTYTVTCLNIWPDTLENPRYGSGDVIKFSLQFDEVLNADGEEVTRELMCNDNLSPLSNLTKFINAFNFFPQMGEDFDLEECIGKKAQAKVVLQKKNDKNGQERTYDRIEDLFPVPQRSSASMTDEDIPQMEIGEFYKFCRQNGGFAIDHVKSISTAMFDKQPKDLTGQERVELYAAL